MGWMDKYGGLTDKGFNYNGAWGGQFKSGGWLDKYQDGGEWFDETARELKPNMLDAPILPEYGEAMRGMMKSKIGMGNAFNHPAIKRMSQAMPKTGMTPEGPGTHYMSSHDHHAIPLLQDTGKSYLEYFQNPEPSAEDIYFQDPKEAEYFGEHYKDVAPMSTIYKGLQEYQTGGSMPGSVGFTYARTGAPSNGKYAKKTLASAQSGEIIDDDMGQWAHPGEITRINSNNITMQGVSQDLLGVSNTGDKKLMKPGKNYKFKGSKVTEYPIGKDGNQLTKLDQLTNFTNYNTKQPGGWLDTL